MTILDRDGVAIHYDAEGQGLPVLLTHGYAATGRMWKPQVEAFKDRCRFITWDLRGHGESGSPDDPSLYSHDLSVEDMCAILDAENIDQAVIGGHSLGGFLSLRFNVSHPERVKALYLQGCGPGYRKAEGREAWNETARKRAERFEELGLEALSGASEVRRDQHHSPTGLAHAARGILSQQDAQVIDSLPHIGVPTLIAVGEDDRAFLGSSDYMAAKIPGAAKFVIEGAGHGCNLDRPERVNEILGEFLSAIA
ncbi:MAG: alpha/beta hydrolase [Gammaproteobacteria bacterium]|jgi:pimeloyl-ACP methyl ester carboxylesterase